MNILQVMPIIKSVSDDSCAEVPQWLANTIGILFVLILLCLLIMLIRDIFDF